MERHGRMRDIGAAAIALAALAVGAGPAAAQSTFGPLTGTGSCLQNPGGTLKGCTAESGVEGSIAVGVIPDGGQVVATGETQSGVVTGYGSLVTLARNATTGALSEVSCLSNDGTDGRDGATGKCTVTPGLRGASGVVVSPNGGLVFTVSAAAGDVAAFSRNTTTGALTDLGCLQNVPPAGGACGLAKVYVGAMALALSPDGHSLYVSDPLYSVISELDASAISAGMQSGSVGSLFGTIAPGTDLNNACVAEGGLDGACTVGVSEAGVTDVAMSPDGNQVYAAAPGSGAIDVLQRGTDGVLTPTGCVMHDAPAGLCTNATMVDEPDQLVVSPDGENVYAVENSGQLDVLSRNATTGQLTEDSCMIDKPPAGSGSGSGSGGSGSGDNGSDDNGSGSNGSGSNGSGSNSTPSPCAPVNGLPSPTDLTISADGSTVAVVSDDGTLTVFSRDASTGALTESSCLSGDDSNCTMGPTLSSVDSLVASPDGRTLYVAGDNQIQAYGLGAGVSSPTATTRGAMASLRLACPRRMLRPCAGHVVLTSLGAHPRFSRAVLARAASRVSSSFRIAPGRSARVLVPIDRGIRDAVAHGHHPRMLAVLGPRAGGGGANEAVVAVSRG
ncbi:MAG TPA: hypothetical protein VHX88_16165 [Solirubrobacteraceae bacterium]|jgi:6-phosphogluconolactonase (cycloisomerase 2 family)|nr:hypothetical protein [Solirubrobacteraceae bacterium]